MRYTSHQVGDNMRKNGILLVFITAFLAFSCHDGTVSPTIAFVEVLDGNGNILKDVSFTATLDGSGISDLDVDVTELSEEELQEYYNDTNYFVIGSYYYDIQSLSFAHLIMYQGEDPKNLLSRVRITAAKAGYAPLEFIPQLTGDISVCYMTIRLVASTGLDS
jgi:hypothetical protein